MSTPKVNSPYQASLDALNAYLDAHEMRMTTVRQIVLNEICQLPQPFTAEQLEEVCRSERISKGTVYNTLKLLEDAHILHVLERQKGRTVNEYEITRAEANRMQVVCTRCGRVTEFHDKAIARLMLERRFPNFNVRHFTLLAYGECKTCSKLKKRNK